ncbi:MAG: DNA recombination/repair protein RecA, partial [Lysobacteraceae bacterium]
KDNARQYLKEHPGMAAELESRLRERFVPELAAGDETTAEAEEA